mgnify:CR=1 FL=1
MLKIGVIGYGYWGPNLVRNFQEVEGAQVTYVCDLDPVRLQKAKARYPSVTTTRDVQEVFKSPDVDAVCIATAVSTHFDLAMQALKAGKHVLAEKPLADSSEKCDRLIDEADRRGRVLMVDHTFPYTPPVQKIKELVETGALGRIYYYDSTRINLGLFQRDMNVIWDLAVHDLSILDYIFREKPVAVSATGMTHFAGQPANVAYLTLFYSGSLIAHINVSWLAPVKVRLTLVSGSEKMVVYDDTNVSEKLKVYDKGITVCPSPENVYQMRVSYRAGDMYAPQIGTTEALQNLARHFIDCVEKGGEPITGAAAGRRVVRIMEVATQSLENKGQLLDIA